MFNNLKNALVMEQANSYNDTLDYINNGYYSTWAEEHRTDKDRGLKEFSTAAKWEQYKAGTISREKAVELAAKRAWKQSYKKLTAQLEKLAAVAAAPTLEYVEISVDWVRSRTWGYNPNVTAWTNDGRYYGRASGCGYDKRSAAVAQALNASNSVLKALYSFKEKQLEEGKNDHSDTAISKHDNRDIIGYGAGYTILPYFEGGVGVDCFWSILKKCGYTTKANERAKNNDYYTISKEA